MQRVHYLDNIKAFLIVSVVLSHILLYTRYLPINDAIFQFCFMFHMPAFIFFSGVLYRELKWRKVVEFMSYYVVFQVLISFIRQYELNFFIPQFHLWFLLSFVSFMFIATALERINDKRIRWGVIGILIGFCLYSRFLPVGFDIMTLSYQKTLSFLPFFLVGKELTLADLQKLRDVRATERGRKGLVLLSLAGFLCVYGIIQDGGLHYLFTGDQNINDHTIGKFALFLTYFVPASIIVLLTCFTVDRKTIFSYVGQKTFILYLYHPLLTLMLEQPFTVRLTLLQSMMLTVCIIITILLLHKGITAIAAIVKKYVEARKAAN